MFKSVAKERDSGPSSGLNCPLYSLQSYSYSFILFFFVEHHTEQISKEAQVFVVQFIRINKSYAIMMSGGWGLVPRKFLTYNK